MVVIQPVTNCTHHYAAAAMNNVPNTYITSMVSIATQNTAISDSHSACKSSMSCVDAEIARNTRTTRNSLNRRATVVLSGSNLTNVDAHPTWNKEKEASDKGKVT